MIRAFMCHTDGFVTVRFKHRSRDSARYNVITPPVDLSTWQLSARGGTRCVAGHTDGVVVVRCGGWVFAAVVQVGHCRGSSDVVSRENRLTFLDGLDRR